MYNPTAWLWFQAANQPKRETWKCRKAKRGSVTHFDADRADRENVPFTFEEELQYCWARNIGWLEKGLRLFDDGTRTGVEFKIGRQRIDILAVDRFGGYLVVELKVTTAGAQALWQLLHYMRLVRKYVATNGEPVRGLLLVRKASKSLIEELEAFPDVACYECRHSLGWTTIQRLREPASSPEE